MAQFGCEYVPVSSLASAALPVIKANAYISFILCSEIRDMLSFRI